MPTGRTTPLGASGGVTGIRLLEQAHVLLDVVALFQERLRVPFAAVDAEEIAAIDVEGAGQARDRIRHRVDDLLSERNGIPHAERPGAGRSEEHTSELQSLMRISYAVFCLKKKKKNNTTDHS